MIGCLFYPCGAELDKPMMSLIETMPEPIAIPELPELEYLGEFVVTGYCPCKKCCGEWSNPESPKTASGSIAEEGRTVAGDWSFIAPGTEILIAGYGYRTVEDKPAKWVCEKYDGKIIDLYFLNHSDAWAVGKQRLEVWSVG